MIQESLLLKAMLHISKVPFAETQLGHFLNYVFWEVRFGDLTSKKGVVERKVQPKTTLFFNFQLKLLKCILSKDYSDSLLRNRIIPFSENS
jgi:hypothetical protein